jgi:hypothetical protein
MTQTPPPKPSSNPTEAAPEDDAPNYAAMFGKGCGWTLLSVALAAGVAFVGHGDVASWGSAIAGVIVLIFILGSSGLTGWWHK